MDILWQFYDTANPADAAIGPQAYDRHLYYRSVMIPLYVTWSLTDVVPLSPIALAYVNSAQHPQCLLSIYLTGSRPTRSELIFTGYVQCVHHTYNPIFLFSPPDYPLL